MPNFSLSDEVFAKAAAEFPTPFHLYDEGGIRREAAGLPPPGPAWPALRPNRVGAVTAGVARCARPTKAQLPLHGRASS